jgi:ribosomal protein S18 acetylase RimI-like enzyme
MTETILRPAPADWLEQVIIRRLRHDDLPALEWDGEYRRFRQVYVDTYQRMRRGIATMWVADLEGTGVIGQVFLQFDCDRKELANGVDRAYFFSFRVRSEYRSAGVGAMLLKVVEDETRLNKMRWLCLNVARDNPRAQNFYDRYGYTIVAAEPGIWTYKDEEGNVHQVHEPAWRMEKDLEKD